MIQPPKTDEKPRRVVVGQDPYAAYREKIREELAAACEKVGIPKLYQPGVVNSPDLSLAMFTLGVLEQVEELKKEMKKSKADLKKKK